MYRYIRSSEYMSLNISPKFYRTTESFLKKKKCCLILVGQSRPPFAHNIKGRRAFTFTHRGGMGRGDRGWLRISLHLHFDHFFGTLFSYTCFTFRYQIFRTLITLRFIWLQLQRVKSGGRFFFDNLRCS